MDAVKTSYVTQIDTLTSIWWYEEIGDQNFYWHIPQGSKTMTETQDSNPSNYTLHYYCTILDYISLSLSLV